MLEHTFIAFNKIYTVCARKISHFEMAFSHRNHYLNFLHSNIIY
jgi:hypothetical protein